MVGQLRDMSEYTENSGRKAVKTVLQYVTRTCDVPRYSISRFFVCLSVVCLSYGFRAPTTQKIMGTSTLFDT